MDEARRFLVVANRVVAAGLQHHPAPFDGVADGDEGTVEARAKVLRQGEARRGYFPVDGRDDDQVEE